MANSPSHKFGQIIGDLLEEIITPQLEDFCAKRRLYLDKKGDRGPARDGRKVSWIDTPDAEFVSTIKKIEGLTSITKDKIKTKLIDNNKKVIETFFDGLAKTLDRTIDVIICIPLHGGHNEFTTIDDAVNFILGYDVRGASSSGFRRFEIIVRYSNADKIDASFESADKAVQFLTYIAGT